MSKEIPGNDRARKTIAGTRSLASTLGSQLLLHCKKKTYETYEVNKDTLVYVFVINCINFTLVGHAIVYILFLVVHFYVDLYV